MSIMQEVSSLHPPGRFLEEDLSGSSTSQASASQNGNGGIHPLILSKVWVPASKDRTIDKILHRLREKKGYTRSIESSSRSPSSHGSTTIRGEQSQLERHVSSSVAAVAVSSANSSIANSVSGQESGTARTSPPNSGTTGLDTLHMAMAMSMLRHNSTGNDVYKK